MERTAYSPVSGQYLIGVNTDGGLRLSINGKRIIDEWGNKKMHAYQRPVTLEAGKGINIQVEYRQQKQPVQFNYNGQNLVMQHLIQNH